MLSLPPTIFSTSNMLSFTPHMSALLQRRDEDEWRPGVIYPHAMQCYAIPYGWPGFVGDVVAFYTFDCIWTGRPPLPVFHNREIRNRRLGRGLATLQFPFCTALGVYNVIRCSRGFSPRRDGLLLIGVAEHTSLCSTGRCSWTTSTGCVCLLPLPGRASQ